MECMLCVSYAAMFFSSPPSETINVHLSDRTGENTFYKTQTRDIYAIWVNGGNILDECTWYIVYDVTRRSYARVRGKRERERERAAIQSLGAIVAGNDDY